MEASCSYRRVDRRNLESGRQVSRQAHVRRPHRRSSKLGIGNPCPDATGVALSWSFFVSEPSRGIPTEPEDSCCCRWMKSPGKHTRPSECGWRDCNALGRCDSAATSVHSRTAGHDGNADS